VILFFRNELVIPGKSFLLNFFYKQPNSPRQEAALKKKKSKKLIKLCQTVNTEKQCLTQFPV